MVLIGDVAKIVPGYTQGKKGSAFAHKISSYIDPNQPIAGCGRFCVVSGKGIVLCKIVIAFNAYVEITDHIALVQKVSPKRCDQACGRHEGDIIRTVQRLRKFTPCIREGIFKMQPIQGMRVDVQA